MYIHVCIGRYLICQISENILINKHSPKFPRIRNILVVITSRVKAHTIIYLFKNVYMKIQWNLQLMDVYIQPLYLV